MVALCVWVSCGTLGVGVAVGVGVGVASAYAVLGIKRKSAVKRMRHSMNFIVLHILMTAKIPF